LLDVNSPSIFARQLVDLIRNVEDTLLIYYVGHGLCTVEGQLALALGDTDSHPEVLPHTSLRYDALVQIMRGCPAASKLVVLDCCHAELGKRAAYAFQSSDLYTAYPVDGLYFIGASKMYEKARAPLGGGLTYFTAAFLDTIRSGVPGGPPVLRLDQIFLALRSRLVRKNLPEPVEFGIRGAHAYPFAKNAASAPDPTRIDSPTADEDPGRAAQTVDDSIDPTVHDRVDPVDSVLALVEHARSFVALDAARCGHILANAVQLAVVIPEPSDRAFAMLTLIETLAEVVPERSRHTFAELEQAARGIAVPAWRTAALTAIAKALAALDPEGAEQIVYSLADPRDQVYARSRITLSMP